MKSETTTRLIITIDQHIQCTFEQSIFEKFSNGTKDLTCRTKKGISYHWNFRIRSLLSIKLRILKRASLSLS